MSALARARSRVRRHMGGFGPSLRSSLVWSSTVEPAAASVDPTSLSMTGFYRDYTNPTWSGTASAGASGDGSHDWADPGTEPAQGTALNGHGTANFNGTDDYFSADGTLDSYISASTFSGWFLLNPDTVVGARHIFCDQDNLGLEIFIDASGNIVVATDAESYSVSHALSASTYSLVTFRLASGTLAVGVNEAPGADGGGTSSAGVANVSTLTGTVVIGTVGGGQYYDGHLAEFGITDQNLSDTTFGDIKTYINTRYGLSL